MIGFVVPSRVRPAGRFALAQAGVAARLTVPHVVLDDVCRGYYEEDGYDRSCAEEPFAAHGESAFTEYVAPYYAYAVERVLEDHAGCVLDLGAGHIVHDRPELFERVRSSCVILMLPSASVDESMSILRDRILGRVAEYAEEGTVLAMSVLDVLHAGRYLSSHCGLCRAGLRRNAA